MNYLAHALADLETPYWVAGTSLPDWLSVVNRRVRARSKAAEPLLEDGDPRCRQLAAGIIQHHADDRWFHGTRVFAELNLQFAVELRDLLDEDAGFRPSFLGHILVEILIDADLIAEDRGRVDQYYRSLQALAPELVERLVGRVTAQPPLGLSQLVPRFISERFLYDYLDDTALLRRLNQVMWRVGLPALPRSIEPWLESARQRVHRLRPALLTPPESPASH